MWCGGGWKGPGAGGQGGGGARGGGMGWGGGGGRLGWRGGGGAASPGVGVVSLTFWVSTEWAATMGGCRTHSPPSRAG